MLNILRVAACEEPIVICDREGSVRGTGGQTAYMHLGAQTGVRLRNHPSVRILTGGVWLLLEPAQPLYRKKDMYIISMQVVRHAGRQAERR